MKRVFIIAGVLILGACMSANIHKLDIVDLKIELSYPGVKAVDSLVPGQPYRVKASVLSADGKETGFMPVDKAYTVSNSSGYIDILAQNLLGTVIKPSAETWRFIGEEEVFDLTVAVVDNPFPGKKSVWRIDWDNYNRLDLSGKQGIEGSAGFNGKDGYGSSSITLDGEDGQDGKDGWQGEDGPDLTVVVCAYNVEGLSVPDFEDNRMLLFYDVSGDRLFLTKNHTFIVDVSGGKGGAAGRGGTYNESKPDPFKPDDVSKTTFTTITGDPGNPGNGGDGGQPAQSIHRPASG